MRCLLCGLFGIATAGVVAAGAAQQPTYRLDLTAPETAVTAPIVGRGGGGGRLSGVRPGVLPLKLTLVGIDRRDVVFGGKITYSVEIANVGSAPCVVPWSADLATVEAAGTASMTAILSLAVGAADGTWRHIGAAVLAGAQELPSTLLTLHPGQTAAIKAVGTTGSAEDAAYAIARAGVAPVRARFAIEVEGDESWEPLLSGNTLGVRFHLRPVPR